jgi:hypothetical protein
VPVVEFGKIRLSQVQSKFTEHPLEGGVLPAELYRVTTNGFSVVVRGKGFCQVEKPRL